MHHRLHEKEAGRRIRHNIILFAHTTTTTTTTTSVLLLLLRSANVQTKFISRVN
jgi:cytochrome P450